MDERTYNEKQKQLHRKLKIFFDQIFVSLYFFFHLRILFYHFIQLTNFMLSFYSNYEFYAIILFNLRILFYHFIQLKNCNLSLFHHANFIRSTLVLITGIKRENMHNI
jgi:hypothetical protein